jgi:hypothetical protein
VRARDFLAAAEAPCTGGTPPAPRRP